MKSHFIIVSPAVESSFLTRDFFMNIAGVRNTLFGAWQRRDYCVLGKYDQEKGEATLRYWRAVSEKLKLGATFNYLAESHDASVRRAFGQRAIARALFALQSEAVSFLFLLCALPVGRRVRDAHSH